MDTGNLFHWTIQWKIGKKRLLIPIPLTDFDIRKSKGPIVPTFFAILRENPDVDLDDKFLSRMMGKYFDGVKEYLEANRLKGHRDEDLIKIVGYYKKPEDAE
jgi:hypothetical protein